MQDVHALHSTAARQRLEDALAAEKADPRDVQIETEEEVDALINTFTHDLQVEKRGQMDGEKHADVDKNRLQSSPDVAKRPKCDFDQYTARLETASAQIVVATTRKEYEK